MKSKLKAGAMSYAIILSIVVGALCMSLIWITAAYRSTRIKTKNEEKLVVNLLSGIKAATSQTNIEDNDFILINGDSVFVKKSNWGMFNYYIVRAVKNGKSLQRSFLAGSEIKKKLPAIYLADNIRSLKIARNTIIRGTVYSPKGRIKDANISSGQENSNTKPFKGKLIESNKQLPELKDQLKNSQYDELVTFENEKQIDKLPFDSLFSFNQPTSRFSQSIPIYLEHNLRGNIIIESRDSIIVRNTSNLENVILKAPFIRFEIGFSGTVQVYAEDGVVLEESVQLQYPSSIYLHDHSRVTERTDTTVIHLQEKASVLGGVLLRSESPDFRNLIKLNIEKNATIVGLVYNEGETQVRGTILGSLITRKLYLNTESSSYENHLLDGEININKVPEYFIYPDWLKGYAKNEKKLKWL